MPGQGDALRAEVDAEDRDYAVTVPLGDVDLDVLPAGQWPGWAIAALRRGDYEAWAQGCLDDDGYAAWTDVDPTGDESVALLVEWGEESGQDVAGILATAAHLEVYAGQVEADLQRYYRLDVRDLYRPGGGGSRLTWRRLATLIEGLPGESATKTAVRDDLGEQELARLAAQPRDGHGSWSQTDLLLAAAIDRLREIVYVLVKANSDGSGSTKPPKPIPRPGVPAGNVRPLNDAGRAYLQRLAETHGATEKPMVRMS